MPKPASVSGAGGQGQSGLDASWQYDPVASVVSIQDCKKPPKSGDHKLKEACKRNARRCNTETSLRKI